MGGFGLLLTSVYWAPSNFVTAKAYEWVGVAVWSLVVVLGTVTVSRWSRMAGWDRRYPFALAAGAALTYVWMSFPVRPEAGGSVVVDLVSNAVIATAAVAVLLAAAAAVRHGE